jgi:hypothetical protein
MSNGFLRSTYPCASASRFLFIPPDLYPHLACVPAEGTAPPATHKMNSKLMFVYNLFASSRLAFAKKKVLQGTNDGTRFI